MNKVIIKQLKSVHRRIIAYFRYKIPGRITHFYKYYPANKKYMPE